MWRRVDIVLTDVSEEHIASIFRVEEKRKPVSEEAHIDGEAMLVVSDMLRVRIFLSPYMVVFGVENGVFDESPLSHFRGPSV
jgi:hypothetical protein